MNESFRLDALHFLRRVQAEQLARTDQWIAEEEQRVAQEAARRPPPPPPDWVIEYGIGQGRPPVAVHTGECYRPGGRMKGITREQALRAVTVDQVRACALCSPDRALGVLD
ncbi:DUF6233 domain-containing protein [Streptomyces sp. NPDC059396]|uniref:DUF6233 domain-containing protein n=1 Tax=Streptomyces sp. NPDC059396 TaxID=3346819 RepID=UPI003686039C